MFSSLQDLVVDESKVSDPYLLLLVKLAKKRASLQKSNLDVFNSYQPNLDRLNKDVLNLIVQQNGPYTTNSLKIASKYFNSQVVNTNVNFIEDLIANGTMDSIKENTELLIKQLQKTMVTAVKHNRPNIVKYFFDRYRNSNSTNEYALLNTAVEVNNEELFNFLVNKGIKPGPESSEIAARNGNTKMLQRITEFVALSPNVLYKACESGNLNTVEFVYNKFTLVGNNYISPNLMDKTNLLTAAIKSSNIEIVKFVLIKYDIEPYFMVKTTLKTADSITYDIFEYFLSFFLKRLI